MSITIEVARRVLEASKQRAWELRSPVSIAIVDAGGNLVLFERMMSPYGWVTGNISIAKASTAVMFNQSTDAVAQWGSAIPGFASSMATMTDGRFIMAAGGWPIRIGGATVGGIGVSGGNAPGRDDEIARAGVAAADRPERYPAQPLPAQPALPQAAPVAQMPRPTVQFGPPSDVYAGPGVASPGYPTPPSMAYNAPQSVSQPPYGGNGTGEGQPAEQPAGTHYLTSDQDDPYEAYRKNEPLNPSTPDQPGGQS